MLGWITLGVALFFVLCSLILPILLLIIRWRSPNSGRGHWWIGWNWREYEKKGKYW